MTDAIDPSLVTELHAKLEAAHATMRESAHQLEQWKRRAEAALRLAESHGTELASLRTTLAIGPETPEQEAKSSSFWFASWREMRRLRAEDRLRIVGLEREVEELRCGDLLRFVNGELESARADKFRDHLGRCKDCEEGLDAHMQIAAQLDSIAEESKR